jgi:hypothetical protein
MSDSDLLRETNPPTKAPCWSSYELGEDMTGGALGGLATGAALGAPEGGIGAAPGSLIGAAFGAAAGFATWYAGNLQRSLGWYGSCPADTKTLPQIDIDHSK